MGARCPELPTVAIASAAFFTALALGDTVNVWLASGLAAVLSLALAGIRHRDALAARAVVTPRGVAAGVVAGALLCAATYALAPLAAAVLPDLRPALAALYARLDAPPGALAALPILAAVVVAEEVIWRGLAVDALERVRPRPEAAVIATALYAVPQLGGSWVTVAAAIGCGGVWTALRVWTGGLAAPLLAHLIWDAVVLLLYPVTP